MDSLILRWLSRIALTSARLLLTPWGRVGIGIAFSLGLGWLAIRNVHWSLVVEHFRGFSVFWAAVALALFIASLFLRAYRWRILFITERISTTRLFIVQNTGIGLNNLSPLRVVSEPTQFAMLTYRYRVPGGVAAATLGMERVLDMVGSSALFVAGLIFIPQRGNFTRWALAAFVLSAIAVLVVVVLSLLSRRQFTGRLAPINQFLASMARLQKARGLLSYSLVLSIVYWFLIGVCSWLLAIAMNLDESPLVFMVVILGTLYFSTSVPAMPGSVGTFEFAIVYFLKFFGVPEAAAFSYALAVHALLFIPPTVVAIAVVSTIGITPSRRDAKAEEGAGAQPRDTSKIKDGGCGDGG